MYCVDHARLIIESEAAGTGQANAAPEQIFGDFASNIFRIPVEGLEVHWLPDRSRFDTRGVESGDEGIAGNSERLLVNQKTTEPVRVDAVRRLRHEGDARNVGKSVTIPECNFA